MERPKRWEHLRSAPARQVTNFLLALFLLFSVKGFYDDLIAGGTEPYVIVLANAALCGGFAVAWLVTIMRLPAWCLIFMLALQFCSSWIYRFQAVWLDRTFHPQAVPSGSGIHFAATSIAIAVFSSYSFFARYMRYTGSESLRFRTVLELAQTIQKTLVPILSRQTPSFDIFGVSQPSEKVGGDLVDALELSSGDTIAYVADIAAHGLFSGIFMGMLKTAVRTALRDKDYGDGSHPFTAHATPQFRASRGERGAGVRHSDSAPLEHQRRSLPWHGCEPTGSPLANSAGANRPHRGRTVPSWTTTCFQLQSLRDRNVC
jgi:hypothetical protein